jgi:hypothetical protein
MYMNDTGGGAFPHNSHSGMTLRDYFASSAITSVAARYSIAGGSAAAKQIAKICYEVADAMIEERRKLRNE